MYRLNYIGNFATCKEWKIVHNTIFLFSQRQLEIILLLITWRRYFATETCGTFEKKWLINQYVCCHWRSTCHLSHKCYNGMSKIDLHPSCGTTCSEVGTLVKCCREFVLTERSVQTASFPTERRVFIVINEDNSYKWWKHATWWLSSSQKSKDANFSSLNRLAPLSEKTQISEPRFKKLFLTWYEFSDTGTS